MVRPLSGRAATLPNGGKVSIVGKTDIPLTIQLMLQLESGDYVHWDRHFTVVDAEVVDLGDHSPRDMYVAMVDWDYVPNNGMPLTPFGSLAFLLRSGATVLNAPRVPIPKHLEGTKVVIQTSQDASDPTIAAITPESLTWTEEQWRTAIRGRISPKFRDSDLGKSVTNLLLARRKVFGPVVPAETTEVVDFTLLGEPTPVSFKVPLSRKVSMADLEAGISDWISRGIAERVPWDTKAYGFVIVVPKSDGRWRITINPSGVNPTTKREDPEGGYMPDSILNEVQKLGPTLKFGASLDLSEAFTTLRLGPTARDLSVFSSPVGKLRWLQGYFGWHSFPAIFQRIVMEKLVLPTMDEVNDSIILAWVDDIVVTGPTAESFLTALSILVDRLLSIGGRLSLEKCDFLTTLIHWCGVEINLETSTWRVDPRRVETLSSTPSPRTQDALSHVLGVIRYYYFTVQDHLAQRERLALLSELERASKGAKGLDISKSWTPAHETAMRDSLLAITTGRWMLVFNGKLPVYVTTDASSAYGFAVTAHQWDPETGELRPISYFSQGWRGGQLAGWTPQVKEMYAIKVALTVIMPATFPYAQVILLCDNRNLSALADSADLRIVRWQAEVRDAGAHIKRWIPGHYNTIADYGSRSVEPDPASALTPTEAFDMTIYSLTSSEGGEETSGSVTSTPTSTSTTTVVPGHLPLASTMAKIIAAQEAAPEEERASWIGAAYSKARLAGHTFYLYRHRLIVPKDASDLKTALIKLAHDENAHYCGAQRTLQQLRLQAKVFWAGMDEDVTKYINSCYRCQFAKAAHHANRTVGSLTPTLPPYPLHTWYVDIKEMPGDTGAILGAVEGLTKLTRLRYIPDGTAKQVIEELEEVFAATGSNPVVIRSDGGPPFNSKVYKEWCSHEGITPLLGIPEHSQGQGVVETKFHGIANSIMAVMGGKAPSCWFKDARLLVNLERVINTTITNSYGGCPMWALTGREPRTRLTALTNDLAASDYGAQLGLPYLTSNDINQLIALHHANLAKVHDRVSLAVSLAQALTKNRYDTTRQASALKVGDWALVYVTAPNRMVPHFTGPYRITRVSDDKNFFEATHYLTPSLTSGPYHVSRLIPFDFSRATPEEIALYQLGEGSGLVSTIKSHRVLDNGSYEFEVEFVGNPVPVWLAAYGLRRVVKAIDYCKLHNLPPLGAAPRAPASPHPSRSSRSTRSGKGSLPSIGSTPSKERE